jgi:hypothetical protein
MPIFTEFSCILLRTDCTVLNVVALTTLVFPVLNDLHIIGGEKKGVPAVLLHNFGVSSPIKLRGPLL